MDRQEFLKLEYVTLREEIRESKARTFKIMGFGLVVVPAANALAKLYHVGVVTLLLPLLILVVALMYLSEVNAAMRCGRYIKLHIEPTVSKITGWENWLEINGGENSTWKTRSVDRYLSLAFYLLFTLYYVGATVIAMEFATDFGLMFKAAYLATSITIGLTFLVYLCFAVRLSTVAVGDDGNRRHKGVNLNARAEPS